MNSKLRFNRLMTWLTMLPLVALMAACRMSQPTLKPASTPPTINCDEHEQLLALPHWVGPRPVQGALTDDEYIKALENYSTSQSVWAVRASGLYGVAIDKRNATADCLDARRVGGSIN